MAVNQQEIVHVLWISCLLLVPSTKGHIATVEVIFSLFNIYFISFYLTCFISACFSAYLQLIINNNLIFLPQ